MPVFRESISKHLNQVYGVVLSEKDVGITHCLGVKRALAMLPLCFINTGDYILTTVPGYYTLAVHTQYLGGKVFPVKLLSENNFLPDLKSIPEEIAKKVKLFYVNYPNNPTGAVATTDFFDELIQFAVKNNVLLVHDAVYGMMVNQSPRLSLLSRPGALESAIELHSLTKCYHLTTLRIGFMVGQKKVIEAFERLRNSSDSDKLRLMQIVASQALTNWQWAEQVCRRYEQKAEKLVKFLRQSGWPAVIPAGTSFVYLPAPKKVSSQVFSNAKVAAEYLFKKLSILTVPYDEAGSYLRFALSVNLSNIQEDKILSEMKARLSTVDWSW